MQLSWYKDETMPTQKLPPKRGSNIVHKDIKITWEWNDSSWHTNWKSSVKWAIIYKNNCRLFYGWKECIRRKNAEAVAIRAATKKLTELSQIFIDLDYHF